MSSSIRCARATTVATAALLLAGTITAHADTAPANVFTVYSPPAQYTDAYAAEPSIGSDWHSGDAMYLADQQVLKVAFDDSTEPAASTWSDVSAGSTLTTLTVPSTPATNRVAVTLDPILYTDSTTGRTFVSELAGACSLMEFTDSDGASWTPSQGCGPPASFDHQTVGGGPYSSIGGVTPPANPVYPHAIYYCAQAVATASCARSDDGGLTFAPAVPVYHGAQCGGLHGHIQGSPDGTVYLPNQNCAPQADPAGFANSVLTGVNSAGNAAFPNQAAVVSEDNGATWNVRVIPGSHASLRSDPSISTGHDGRTYFFYEDAVNDANGHQAGGHAAVATTTDHGVTWSAPVDIGATLGIQNVQFPEIVAGDAGRAAVAFLGSTTSGDPEDGGTADGSDPGFQGTWDLYMGYTYDSGLTWSVQDVTPGHPVQRGCMYLAGNGTCPGSKRNLLDFMTLSGDQSGRALLGYAGGCTGGCATAQPCSSADTTLNAQAVCDAGPGASTAAFVQIARQSSGRGLLAAFDSVLATGQPGTDLPESPLGAAGFDVAAAVLVPAAVWRRRRRAAASH